MLSHVVSSVSFESFRESSMGKKVILLYPWTNHRNVFLSYFLNDCDEGLLYYRLPEHASALAHWLGRLRDEIRIGAPEFGKLLERVLESGTASELGEALAADIEALPLERVVLYLDELDRIPQDEEFRQFMNAAIANLPVNAQLVISSRLLTYDPWISWVNRDEVVVLGTEHRSSNFALCQAEQSQAAVGSLRIWARACGLQWTRNQQLGWRPAAQLVLLFH